MTKSTVNEIERMVVTRIFDAPRELVWKAWTDRRVLLHLFARWIFAWEENFSAA